MRETLQTIVAQVTGAGAFEADEDGPMSFGFSLTMTDVFRNMVETHFCINIRDMNRLYGMIQAVHATYPETFPKE